MQSHSISEKQARELGKLIVAANQAGDALRMYFTAVADGLGLPEGTKLIRVEDAQLITDAESVESSVA